jgi:hypothetical protein
MYDEKTVFYDPKGGPVTLEIKALYATLGSYSAAFLLKGISTPLGNGKLGDNIPDVYILPVNTTDLQSCRLYISGTYIPAPGHIQINVAYHLRQDGQMLVGDNPIVIEEKKESLSTTHRIDFKERM